MPVVDDLDAERGGEFWYQRKGAAHQLPHPSSVSWNTIAQAARDTSAFITEIVGDPTISVNAADRLRADWMRHYGLGRPGQIDMLAFLLERYRTEIEYDLLALPGCPTLGELWRDRRVRFLLNVIDKLPPNTHTNAAIAKNEEHVALMVKAGLKPAKGVSAIYYGSVEQRLDTAIDAMNRVGDLLIATNAPRGRRTPPTPPQKRPSSSFGKLRHQERVAQHRALTARVLPNGPQPAPAARVAGGRRRDRRLLDGTAVIAEAGTAAFVRPGIAADPAPATREEERNERWKARAREVGRVPRDGDEATEMGGDDE